MNDRLKAALGMLAPHKSGDGKRLEGPGQYEIVLAQAQAQLEIAIALERIAIAMEPKEAH